MKAQSQEGLLAWLPRVWNLNCRVQHLNHPVIFLSKDQGLLSKHKFSKFGPWTSIIWELVRNSNPWTQSQTYLVRNFRGVVPTVSFLQAFQVILVHTRLRSIGLSHSQSSAREGMSRFGHASFLFLFFFLI